MDLEFSQVATADIGRKAAELLDRLDFKGRRVLEFAGPKELTMVQATKVLGMAIGKPGLKYVEFPYEEAEKSMAGSGMKPATAKLMVDMYRGFNEGLVKPEGPLTERGSIPIEDFAVSFAQAYKG
jgi:uncharacterized protein YbjT (DUF2867 family)